MLIYVLLWRPSWISDRHKKQKLGKGHSNDLIYNLGSDNSLVSEKKSLPLQTLGFLFRYEIQNGGYGRT
jgi:hypothetical protein